ncbi:MAG: leucine-rich repeat protein, partial [Oscillospiraceae bacterium]|nr:leucine-rich repeat protein [Oscillospiraceae bacterium]
LLLALALVPALGGRTRAETSGVYTYSTAGGEATILRCDSEAAGALSVPAKLGGCPVTAIGDNAFSSCGKITSVTLPAGVTDVGRCAFQGCTALKSVTLPAGLTVIRDQCFSGCSALTSAALPTGVTAIEEYAFSHCTSLKTVSMPKKLNVLGTGAFLGCSRLTSVTLPAGLSAVGPTAFWGCAKLTSAVVPEGVTEIGASAFRDCAALESVSLPSTLKTLSDEAFAFCSSLKTAALPAGLERIGQSAFFGCESLTKIVIPAKVKTVGMWAFRECGGIRSAVVPQSVTAMDSEVFTACGSLKNIWCVAASRPAGWAADWVGDNEAGPAVRWGRIPAPTGLKAKALTAGGIQLSWKLSDGATKYNVFRRTAGGEWENVGYSRTGSYTDAAAAAGTAYSYRVQAQVSKAFSSYTEAVPARWLTAPAAPTAVNGVAGVKLSWGKVTGASLYYVWRAEGSGSFVKLAESRTASFTDKTAESGKTYRYAVKARYSDFYSALGAEAKTVYLAAPETTVKAYVSGIKLTWGTVPGATLYNIWRASPGGSYEKIGTSRTLSYVDKTVVSGKTYRYYVTAQYSKFTSSHNAAVSAKAK